MKTKIKERVGQFIDKIDTKEMNTNQFIWGFLEFYHNEKSYAMTSIKFISSPSVESITRARRFINNHYNIKRENADSEETYINEFGLVGNKY